MNDKEFNNYKKYQMSYSKLKGKHDIQEGWNTFNMTEEEKEWPFNPDPTDIDRVNSPTHYTQGTQEAIDIIEEAIDAAPSVQSGMLQAQVLKYLLRLWHKDNPLEDARKGRWYLNRLINRLE